MKSSLLRVSLKPRRKFSMRQNLFGLVANCPSVPRMTDSEFGPGLGKSRAAVGFVGAAF